MSYLHDRAASLLKEFKGDAYAFGNGVLDDSLGNFSAALGKKVLMVGPIESPWFAPLQKRIVASLENAGMEIVGLAKSALPNAPFEDVYRIHSHIVHKKPEVILAAGGGSAIDASKASAILASLGDREPELDPFFGVGEVSKVCRETGRKIMSVVAVMTAASSAAHLTKYSNITDPVQGQKKLIVDEAIIPPRAVFDYEATASQPMNLTLDGGLDGIAHCLEVYLGATSETKGKLEEISSLGIELIIEGLTAIKQDPQNQEARVALGLGTDLGGYAIMVGGTSGAHLTSFSLVDVLTHGRACALMNPYYAVFFAKAIQDQLRTVGRIYQKYGHIEEDLDTLTGRELGVTVARGMVKLSEYLGFPTRLKDVAGIGNEHIRRCLEAAKNPQLDMKLRNMPVPLHAELVDEYMGPILEAAWEGDFKRIKDMP